MRLCVLEASAVRSPRGWPKAMRSISSMRQSAGWRDAKRPSPTTGSLSAARYPRSRTSSPPRVVWYRSSLMPIDVIMPKVDMVMEEGTVAQWYKSEGDQVKAGEPLFDIERD